MPNWKKVIVSGSDASLNTVSTNYIDFNTGSAIPAWKSGRVFWDNTEGALSVYNAEADITLQVGQENWTRVYNDTGATIANGAPVRIIGTHGDHPEVVLAQSIQVSGSSNLVNQILGLATHDIEASTFGYVTTQGLVRGLDTNAFIDGDTLYLSSSAGQLTATVPAAPYEIVPVGQVVKAGPGGSGIIYVAVQQPLDFTDLSSVALGLGTYQDGDIWTYHGPSKQWRHQKQLSGSYGLTGSLDVNGSARITGSLGVTGSFSVLDSIDGTNKILIGSGPIPGSTEDSVNWDSRTLLDSNGNFSVRWGALRTMFDASQVDSISWDARILKDALGNDSGQWGMRRLISTNTSRSIDWENRSLHDFSGNITVEWTSTALYDVSAKNALNWDARDAYDSAEIPAINWDARRLIDSSAVAAVRWDLRSAYDTVDSQSIDWGSRLLKIDNGPGAYTVNWNAGILRDTNSKNSVDWQNRILIDASDVTTVDWKNAKLNANTTSQSVNWNNRVLTDSAEATSLDWNSRRGYGNGGSIVTLDWGGLALIDSGGTLAVDWRNRYLADQGAVTRIEWDSPSFISQINHYAYSTNKIDLSAETEALTNYSSYGNTFTPAGEIINNVTFDVGVSDYDMVSLTSTGTWVQTSMTTQDAFKMLGIAFNVGSTNSVLLEGHMVVSSGSNGAPKISDLTIGRAVYMNTTSSGVFMSNTAPVVTGQTVRLLGHVYYNSTNDATWYTMKFRPSHDWVTL